MGLPSRYWDAWPDMVEEIRSSPVRERSPLAERDLNQPLRAGPGHEPAGDVLAVRTELRCLWHGRPAS